MPGERGSGGGGGGRTMADRLCLPGTPPGRQMLRRRAPRTRV